MPEKYDRREMLKWIGASLMTLILLPLGLAGCGGGEDEAVQTPAPSNEGGAESSQTSGGESGGGGTEETHNVPHPEDVELTDAEANGTALGGAERAPGGKSSKDGPSVQFQHEPNGEKHCGNCTMFVPDENGDGFGACTLVEGDIHSCDFCILYSKATGEKTIPCKAT